MAKSVKETLVRQVELLAEVSEKAVKDGKDYELVQLSEAMSKIAERLEKCDFDGWEDC